MIGKGNMHKTVSWLWLEVEKKILGADVAEIYAPKSTPIQPPGGESRANGLKLFSHHLV